MMSLVSHGSAVRILCGSLFLGKIQDGASDADLGPIMSRKGSAYEPALDEAGQEKKRLDAELL